MATWPKWKVFEKKVADYFGWTRVVRADNYATSAPDIIPKGVEFAALQIDCKKRKRFAHHSLMDEVRQRYCLLPGHEPVLFTQEVFDKARHKAGQELPVYATISMKLLKQLCDDRTELITLKGKTNGNRGENPN